MAESSGSVVSNNVNIQKQSSVVQRLEPSEENKTEKVNGPILLEDFTYGEEPKSLVNILNFLKTELSSASKNDIMAGIIYILMVESGFVTTEREKENLPDNPDFNYKRLLELSIKLPKNWKKNHIYNFSFTLVPFSDHVCNIGCVPLADDLLVNCSIRSLNAKFNMMIDPTQYLVSSNINLHALQFQNLKSLSQIFKTEISYPAKCLILNFNDVKSVCLENLPQEIILNIITHLKVKDLLYFGCTSKYFRSLIEEPKIWRRLLLYDFKKVSTKTRFLDLRDEYRSTLSNIRIRNKLTARALNIRVHGARPYYPFEI